MNEYNFTVYTHNIIIYSEVFTRDSNKKLCVSVCVQKKRFPTTDKEAVAAVCSVNHHHMSTWSVQLNSPPSLL